LDVEPSTVTLGGHWLLFRISGNTKEETGAMSVIEKSALAEYRNTKVAELTPPQPVITRVLAALIIVLTGILAAALTNSSAVTPRITASFSPALTIDYLLNASPTEQQCERVAERFILSISRACPECAIQSSCNKGDLYRDQLETLASSTLAASLPNGSAAYVTADRELALSLCASNVAVENDLRCTTVETLLNRPVDSVALTRDAWVLLSALILLLTAMTGIAFVRNKNLAPLDQAMTGHRQTSAVSTWLSDLIAVTFAWLAVAHGLWLTEPLPQSQLFNLTTASITSGLALWFMIGARHYARRRAFYDELWQCFNAIVLAGLVQIAVTAVTGASDLWPVVVLWTSVLVLLPTFRWCTRTMLDDLGLWRRPVIIVGTGENASSAIKAVTDDFTLGYKVLAVADPDASGEVLSSIQVDTGLPVVSLDQVDNTSDKVQVLIALDSLQNEEAQKIVQRLVASNRRVHMIPSLRGLPTMGMQVSHFFSHNTVMLTMRNNLARADFKIMKRAFDIIASGLGLLLLSPLFIVVSLRVMQDGGPAFYGHERVGKRGKPFKCLKFRSMHIDSQRMLRDLLESDADARAEWERDFKLKDDPRVTSIGKFIRESSIDELPQLINVFRGDMSLVGPRPIITEELERYGDFQQFYLRVSPGITGLWQVSGRSDTSYDERVGLDVWYTQNWSIVYDIAILFKTVGVVFGKKGAY
jgi:Undecaprenyl-phosphate galactose phosphotransferase WbaP